VYEVHVNPVAWNKVASGLCNTDDRLSGTEFFGSDSEIGVALDVQGGCAWIARDIEPLSTSQSGFVTCGHVLFPLDLN
jgi:hypothetical protein